MTRERKEEKERANQSWVAARSTIRNNRRQENEMYPRRQRREGGEDARIMQKEVEGVKQEEEPYQS